MESAWIGHVSVNHHSLQAPKVSLKKVGAILGELADPKKTWGRSTPICPLCSGLVINPIVALHMLDGPQNEGRMTIAQKAACDISISPDFAINMDHTKLGVNES